VLVLWTGYRAGAQACRSLARAGHHVVGAHPDGDAGGSSRWCRRPLRYPPPGRDAEAFLGRLTEICRTERIDVVLPVDEDIVRLFGQRRPDLAGAVSVGPDEHQYRALCDKRELARSALAVGVDHPGTVTVGVDGPDGPWPALPCMVKPVVSHSDMDAAGISFAATVEERDAAVARLLRAGIDALVQERIDGRRWVGHCVRDAARVDVVCSRISRDYPRRTGVACVQRTTEPPPGLVAAIERLLGHVDYRGPATISFLERDGRLYVHDVNLRLGASVGLMVGSGFDLPQRAVEVALGVPAPARAQWAPTRYVWLDGELEALRDALKGRDVGESAARVAARIAAAAALPGRMTDPGILDPWWFREKTARVGRVVSRRLGRSGEGR
jgi:predicted ATP-grasp superfamily ATP-dependent carboligase